MNVDELSTEAPKKLPKTFYQRLKDIFATRRQLKILLFLRACSLVLILHQALNMSLTRWNYSSFYQVTYQNEFIGFQSYCVLLPDSVMKSATDFVTTEDSCQVKNGTIVIDTTQKTMTENAISAMNALIVVVCLKFLQWFNLFIIDSYLYSYTKSHLLKQEDKNVTWGTLIHSAFPRDENYIMLIVLSVFHWLLCFLLVVSPVLIYFLYSQGNVTLNPWNNVCSNPNSIPCNFNPLFMTLSSLHQTSSLNNTGLNASMSCLYTLAKQWYRLNSALCIFAKETVQGSFQKYELLESLAQSIWNTSVLSLLTSAWSIIEFFI